MPLRPSTKLSRADLADLNAFLVVHRVLSFTQAAMELGVTTSALSHAIRNLESRLGVRLLNRTSRTVSPTQAGDCLARRLDTGFAEIIGALEDINRHRDRPAGRLRLNVLSDGARLLLARALPAFLQRYPDMEVEVAVDDHMIDIVAAGFDAGLRFGDTVPEDFVALRIGAPLKWVAVAAPRYLNRSPLIREPEDLKHHNCIQLRTGQGSIYRWEFENAGERVVVEVPGQLCVNETTLGIDMANAGAGIMYCLEERVHAQLEAGTLQIVLPDWAPTEPAFYVYYPGHRRPAPGLPELIDILRNNT